MHGILFDEFAHGAVHGAGGVALIRIDMHGQRELFAHADHHIAESQRAAVCFHLDGNHVLVLDAEFVGVGRRHMDVALRGDHALGHLDFTAGADQFARAGTGDITGLTDRRGNADGPGVRQGQLHLGCGTDRPENADALQGVLRSDDIHLLLAGKLSGLRQPALDGQLMAGAEQGFQVFLGYVNMAGRGFHNKLFHDARSFR